MQTVGIGVFTNIKLKVVVVNVVKSLTALIFPRTTC